MQCDATGSLPSPVAQLVSVCDLDFPLYDRSASWDQETEKEIAGPP